MGGKALAAQSNSQPRLGRLSGKRILITGTGGGQGAAAQRAFCQEGAVVVGCDLRNGAAEKAAQVLTLEGFEAYGKTVDLTVAGAAREFVDWGVEVLGGLDVVYNNASATEFAPFADMTRELWDFSIRNELDIVFDVAHVAWRHYTVVMEDQEYSSIRPLVDWLDYNGYTVITKGAKEFVGSASMALHISIRGIPIAFTEPEALTAGLQSSNVLSVPG